MYKNLKSILNDYNIEYKEISNALNIKSLGTISLKVNNKSHFTLDEAKMLRNLINSKSKKKYTLEELFEI